MRILILEPAKWALSFTDTLSFQHETAVFDVNPHQLRFCLQHLPFHHAGGNQGV